MDLEQRLSISYYKNVAVINESHNIYLAQHQESGKFYVKKILDVYSIDVYKHLIQNPIPGVPRIIEYFDDGHSLTLIEEYISGTSLKDIISSGSLTKEQLIHYITKLCVIVASLHSQEPPIIHRDIKPSNIIITNNDDVVLLDFNAAKHKFSDSNNETDTILLGTQGYAAPEQYGFQESSPQSDIFSIGVLLKTAVASISDYDCSFDRVIEKCTQMDPLKRYHSANTLKMAVMLLSKDRFNFMEPARQIFPFLPPGFRTLMPGKMLFATAVYSFFIWVCLTFDIEGTTLLVLWISRILTLLTFIGDIFIVFNYQNIQKKFALCKSKNIFVRAMGIMLLVIIFTTFMYFLLLMVSAILLPK